VCWGGKKGEGGGVTSTTPMPSKKVKTRLTESNTKKMNVEELAPQSLLGGDVKDTSDNRPGSRLDEEHEDQGTTLVTANKWPR